MSQHNNCCGMEDVPMTRYSNPIPVCEDMEEGACCSCRRELERILEALSCQNQILVDLLGAVNCLTAALLAERK